ncbi:glutaredoxin family protein [Reinekea thalattae]|uniref:Glutaredoxin n=1 Tax=Reinekea thalattae TaxID=2593301 RepID=A0A5C8ZBT6_9GAMM|nr:glutaredoxin [Reinekea thalattae]TXR54280.1 glutaredoxin [Reinekea thalattae]
MSQATTIKHLSLYHYDSCPFCLMTKAAIKKTKVNIEQRNIQKNRAFEKQLVQQGGKRQVPCLRIEESNGEVRWLYESRDIIAWVQEYARSN